MLVSITVHKLGRLRSQRTSETLPSMTVRPVRISWSLLSTTQLDEAQCRPDVTACERIAPRCCNLDANLLGWYALQRTRMKANEIEIVGLFCLSQRRCVPLPLSLVHRCCAACLHPLSALLCRAGFLSVRLGRSYRGPCLTGARSLLLRVWQQSLPLPQSSRLSLHGAFAPLFARLPETTWRHSASGITCNERG